jgi:diguanylate cyclase (GGDEF)-like protein
MYLERMGSRPGSISAALYMNVVRTLHGSMVAILSAAVSHVIGGFITLRETGDIVSGALMIVGLIVIVIRACEVLAFRRRVSQETPLEFGEANRWRWAYGAGTVASAFVHGLFAARSLMLDSQICSMIAVGIAFGCSAGLLTRLSLLPFVVLANLCALGLPAIMVSLALLDIPHVALAVLIVVYLAGTFEMARQAFNSAIDQIRLKEKFEQLARLDPMTGVFNRSHLTSELPRILADRRDGMIAIHAVDLDHFKAANDRFGHPVGDALLKEVAARLTSLAGPQGSVVRMGGDEFILVQRVTRSRADAETLAGRIRDSVSAPYSIEGHIIVVGASIGIAIAPEDGTSVEALLSRSDKALYQAKRRRGAYVFADETTTKTLAHKPAAHSCAA